MIYNVIILLMFFIGCSSHQGDMAHDTIQKQSTSFKKWVFKVDNNNSNSIGYKIYTDDESIGVKGICIDGDYVYITDVYHTNIKRINTSTGEIKSSKSLSVLPADDAGVWLRELAVFNDKIYAPADRDTIYVFSKDLSLLQSIPVKNREKKYIESIDTNGIEIFFNNYESTGKAGEITLLFVNKKGEVSTIKKQIQKEEEKQQSETTIQGKPFKTYTKNGKDYFECEYGTIELKTPIPEIKEYGALNLNFNSSTLVYFNSTPTEFILYVYEY